MDEFELDGRDYVELNNLLKLTGLSPSGGMAKLAIAGGDVTVDGTTETRKRCKIRAGQIVAYDNKKIVVVPSP